MSTINQTAAMLLLLLLLLTHYAHSQGDLLAGPLNAALDPELQCQELSFEQCRQFGYNSTRMPNVLGQIDQDDAKSTAIQLLILNQTGCSHEYAFYICQMLFPICPTTTGYQKPILPCKSMCLRVYTSCLDEINKAKSLIKGANWPQELECDKLPVDNPTAGVCSDQGYHDLKLKQQSSNSQHHHSNRYPSNNHHHHQQQQQQHQQQQQQYQLQQTRQQNKSKHHGDSNIEQQQQQQQQQHRHDQDSISRPLDETDTIEGKWQLLRKPYEPPKYPHDNDPLIVNMTKSLGLVPGRPKKAQQPSGAQCDCTCRAPLIPIVDLYDRRYYNRVHLGPLINCAYPCQARLADQVEASSNHQQQSTMNMFLTQHEQQSLNTVINILAWCCLTLTSFTLVTFLSDIYRFKYPNRCVVFLCACYLLVSLGYLLRSPTPTNNSVIVTSATSISMIPPATSLNEATLSPPQGIVDLQQKQQQLQLQLQTPFYCDQNLARYPGGGIVQLRCLATFFLTYTFLMAANVWWVILTIVWFMSSLNWAQETLSSYSQCFHLIAWLLPLTISIILLATEAIDGDIHMSMCSVGNLDLSNLQFFVIIPQIAYLAIGFLFVATLFVSLIRKRNLIRLQNLSSSSLYKSSPSAASINHSSPSSSAQVSPSVAGYSGNVDQDYLGKSSMSKQPLTVNITHSGATTTTTGGQVGGNQYRFPSLKHVEKLDRSIMRIGLFCLLYITPMLILVACLLYEQYSRPIRERQFVCAACPGGSNHSSGQPSLSPFGQSLVNNVTYYQLILVRHICILSFGMTSSLWLCFNNKTFRHWRKLVRKILGCCCATDTSATNYNDTLDLHVQQNQRNLHKQQQQQLLQQNILGTTSRSLTRSDLIVDGSKTTNQYHQYDYIVTPSSIQHHQHHHQNHQQHHQHQQGHHQRANCYYYKLGYK